MWQGRGRAPQFVGGHSPTNQMADALERVAQVFVSPRVRFLAYLIRAMIDERRRVIILA